MADVESLSSRNRPSKSWGWEEWIVNNDLYCGKRLHFTVKGGKTSLHFHAKKHETMFVEKGTFSIVIVNTGIGNIITHDLKAGDSIVIVPNTPHRIIATGLVDGLSCFEAVLVEFSTHHEDSDSYRISP